MIRKQRWTADVRRGTVLLAVLAMALCRAMPVFAAENPSKAQKQPAAAGPAASKEKPSAGDLIVKAWTSHGVKDAEHFKSTLQYTRQLIDLYKAEADAQQASLKSLPKNRPDIEAVQILNDVGTAYFIQGECYRDQGKAAEAIEAFKVVLYKYCYAQAWDPRGWFWKVALASKESILKLNPKEELAATPCGEEKKPDGCEAEASSKTPTTLKLADPGKEEIIDYAKYGEFTGVGTKDYKYTVKDQESLIAAAGEGVFPNTSSVRNDPAYKKAQAAGRLKGSHWCVLHSPDVEAAFFKWATAPEPQGVKLFYTALVLERAGLIKQAVKCYYAIVVHFPGQYGWTYWHTPWYVGQAAVAKIQYLLRKHPDIEWQLVDADVKIVNGYDNDIANDIAITNPGRLMKVAAGQKRAQPPAKPQVKRSVGKGAVRLVQYATGDWEILVNDAPYVIKGITYSPTKVGQSPDNGTQTSWMDDDFNANGKADGPYDSFFDKNRNNAQDADEPSVGDFMLMKEMGVNTIRLYHHPLKVDKAVLRDMYERFGIRVIMGDFLGKYALGSGAKWNPGTDYNDEQQKKNMIDSVKAMVSEYKDEPYILFWLLGNENVYGYACNADKYPEEYFKFANEVAKVIKELDPQHPVAICSGDILFLDKFGKLTPDIDMFGTNAYRGEYGFGRFWKSVREEADKPAFITEFGCPAHADGYAPEDGEVFQAAYHQGSWEDIRNNMAFHGGEGNAVGGVVFEWLDEWWKAYEPSVHDSRGLWAGPFPDGFMHEEWLGVAGQGDGKASPFLRQLRKAYYMYKKIWQE